MDKEKSGFFLVREEILPEAIKKTIRVKEMLKRGDARTINEAVEKMELSRSAYYKYKDYVFPFYEASQNKIVTLTFLLEHKKGVLSSLLNTISNDSGRPPSSFVIRAYSPSGFSSNDSAVNPSSMGISSKPSARK